MHDPRPITERIRIITSEQAALLTVWMSPAEAKAEIEKKRRKEQERNP